MAVLAAPLAACGGGGDDEDSTRVRGDTLTIYASLPSHGLDAPAGDDAAVGMRRALADARGRAGGRSIRFVRMSSTRPGDRAWDPGTVEANADRAADDPTTIAYLGELDRGGSAVSLPVTNRRQILQISPADALTSLTRTPPGRPRAGPERYYPGERQTFVRLVSPDLVAARRIVAELREHGTRRLAIVTGDGVADHELEAMILGLIGEGQPRTVTRVGAPNADDDPARVAELTDELAEAAPQAIVYAADSEPRAWATLAALAARLPGVPVIEGPALAQPSAHVEGDGNCANAGVPAESALSRAARRRLETIRHQGGRDLGVEALLGYDAMRLALAAIDSGGPDRLDVVRAAKALAADYRLCG
ncbi:MAG TPA: hypothetical protein VHF88_08095 [Thermoleophilaceae bacterium]|nr:hypothetical protein [Thermoleophilaceae bacterium]